MPPFLFRDLEVLKHPWLSSFLLENRAYFSFISSFLFSPACSFSCGACRSFGLHKEPYFVSWPVPAYLMAISQQYMGTEQYIGPEHSVYVRTNRRETLHRQGCPQEGWLHIDASRDAEFTSGTEIMRNPPEKHLQGM